MTSRVLVGDCLEAMRALDPESVDAVVTDPPYGLGFMGKDWDTFAPEAVARNIRRDTRTQKRRGLYGGKESDVPSPAMAAARYDTRRDDEFEQSMFAAFTEMLRLAKPGAYLVTFGSTRRHHRLMCGIEDAGWEIRDTLAWLFGNGFPKSLNVGEGRGTALKPAWEPIILARKPLAGTTGENVEQFGTGSLNIDACRIEVGDESYKRNCSGDRGHAGTRVEGRSTDIRAGGSSASGLGRWPANVVLDDESAALLDQQTGELISGANPTRRGSNKFASTYGEFIGQQKCNPARGVDVGGASRFFYCAKASAGERHAGLEGMPDEKRPASRADQAPGGDNPRNRGAKPVPNSHPTVKPISLMRWLCKLVTPANGLILDPFCGSGTTGCAASLEGLGFVGIEREPSYAAIAERRIAYWSALREPSLFEVPA